jgi:type IV pilus biogenesis protein CpaD/CtpE
MRPRLPTFLLALAAAFAGGCAKAPPAPAPGETALHRAEPPHGGTPVVLGQEEYQLELVVDRAAGRLQAYVLDGEMEDFVRSSSPALELTVALPGGPRPLVLAAVANPVTGETIGDTALFEGHADWLRTTPDFEAELAKITIRGTPFTKVRFNFPQGNGTSP